MSVIPAKHGRPAKDGKLPVDKYHRQMKTRFNHKAYRKRPQVETVMSMLKRNLGDSLAGRSWPAKYQDMLLMCLTHNIAIVLFVFGGWGFLRSLMQWFFNRGDCHGIETLWRRLLGDRANAGS